MGRGSPRHATARNAPVKAGAFCVEAHGDSCNIWRKARAGRTPHETCYPGFLSPDQPDQVRSANMNSRDLPEIILHLGAHRTGTTRLQTILDANQDILAENGIAALTPPRPGKRGCTTIRDVLKPLPPKRRIPIRHSLRMRKARATFSNLIANDFPDRAPRRIIVSEENLLSLPFLKTGFELYPSVYPRLVAFQKILGCVPSEVHLTIRAYDTFLVSLYALHALHMSRRMPSFDDFRQNYLAVHWGWPNVIASVTRAFPATPLKLTQYERDPVESRVRNLVGPELFAGFRLDGDERPNIAPTVEAMAAATRSNGQTSRDDLVTRYADGTRFDPLDEEERSILARRYETDLASLEISHPSRLPTISPGDRWQ